MDSAGLAQAITTYWSQTFEHQGQGSESPQTDETVLPMISIAGIHRRIKRALSSRSARAWLLKLGRNWKEVKKGVYRDGHEREDIKEYRDNVFLPRMQSCNICTCSGNGTQERAVQDLLCLVDLYLVYLI